MLIIRGKPNDFLWQVDMFFFFGACVLTYLFLFLLFDSKRIKFEI